MNKFWVAGLLTALLAGCGSNVKLDEVPVEDRKATSVAPPAATGGQAGTGAQAGAPAQSAVAPVSLAPAASTAPGPQVERLIYFDYDSFAIKPEFQSVVEANAAWLRADRNRRVFVEGHTDERGGREYNLALGQKRAEAVRRALVLLGVADNQVEAVSFGEEKPAAQGQDESVWSRNRRAEMAYR